MYTFEKAMADRGFAAVCGLDEAGCGPLAGPVYAAAVILRPGHEIEGLDDSKKLSASRREALFDIIQEQAAAWAVAAVEAAEIDRINILQARLLAMSKAVESLGITPDCALVDGDRDPGLDMETLLIVKGDQKSASIAAASILAKVSRDRLMTQLDALYPQYSFARHKGYPTKLHYAALEEHGPCPEHRRSFLKKFDARLAGTKP